MHAVAMAWLSLWFDVQEKNTLAQFKLLQFLWPLLELATGNVNVLNKICEGIETLINTELFHPDTGYKFSKTLHEQCKIPSVNNVKTLFFDKVKTAGS